MAISGNPLAGYHHARYLRDDTVYHVISRTFQGRGLLPPRPELNAIIVGVLARARRLYPRVEVYAAAFMSNHMHMQLRGPTVEVPKFIAYLKREIGTRWGKHPKSKWRGSMWQSYKATALPTFEAQENTFKYILSQGVKEGLVATPTKWPGVHCARSLVRKKPLRGTWFNGTRYSKDVDTQSRAANPKVIRRMSYVEECSFQFDTLPAWEGLSEKERDERLAALIAEIEAEGRQARGGRKPVGVKRLRQISVDDVWPMAAVPWLERRRRMVCWSDPRQPETRAYLEAYWEFQLAFRSASQAYLGARDGPPFPVGAFMPGILNHAPLLT